MVRVSCPRYNEALEEVFETEELKKVAKDNAQLYQELTEHTGAPVKTPEDVSSLYSTLRAETEYGLKLPAWTKKYYPEQLIDLTDQSYIYNVYTDELKKFKAGPWYEKLLKEYSEKVEGKLKPKDRKILMYTGHDSTVVNYLHALGVWDKQFPTYGIMAIWELVKDKQSGVVGVQMYLRNSTRNGATPLTIPGCSHFCPLDDFAAAARKVIPLNFEKECQPKNKNYTPPPPSGP